MGEQILNDASTYEVVNSKREDVIAQIYSANEEWIKNKLHLGNIRIDDWNYL